MPIQAEVLEAQVKVTGVQSANRDLDSLGRHATNAGSQVNKAGSSMGKMFKFLGAAAIGGTAVKFLKDANAEARESQKVGAQTTAVLKSTGNAAKVTATHVGVLANAISRKTGIDDEAIQSASNLLLTFTKVRDEVGKGNKIFSQATQVATDMGAALGGDPKSSAIQLGKALNDPVKGIVALTRAGVTFDDKQKASIKTMAAHNHLLGAQKVILKELTKEFGGSAAAQATWGDKATVAWKNLEEQVGLAFQPTFDHALESFTTKGVPAISKFITQMQTGTGEGGKFAAVIRDEIVPDAKQLAETAGQLFRAMSPILGLLDALPTGLKGSAVEMLGFYSVLTKVVPKLPEGATGFEQFGRGLRTLAGAGGLSLLTSGLNDTNKATGTLSTTLGGIAAGASVGGLWGAAIGGLGGLFLGLSNDTKKADTSVQDYMATLDQLTAKQTEGTRTKALTDLQKAPETSGYQIAANYGIPDRALVNAATGPVNQFLALRRRLYDTKGLGKEAADRLLASIQAERDALGSGTSTLLQRIAATKDWGHQLDRLPKNVRVAIKQDGLIPTAQGVADLVKKLNLVGKPKRIKAIIDATGVDTTVAKVRAALKRMANPPKIKPTVEAATSTAALKTLLDSFNGKAKSKAPKIKPSVDGQGATVTMSSILSNLQAQANAHPIRIKTTGGSAMGGTIVRGMAFGGTVPGQREPYGDKVLRMLAPGEEVIPNGNGEADHFRALRRAGLIPGMAKGGTVTKAQKAARGLGAALSGMGLADAVKTGLGPVERILARMERLVKARTSGAREKRLERILHTQGDRLEKIQKRRDSIASRLNVATAKRDALVSARDEFRGNVVSGISSQANVLNSGNSASQIAANLSTQVGKAQEFAKAIQAMRRMGYSSAVIQQVAAAGIESGLETAKALVAGTKGDVSGINSSFATITKTASDQGKLLSDQFYKAGVESANGVVRGLTKQKGEIEHTLAVIAKGMVKALRSALGIKSPSTKFRAEMDWVGKGIVRGLKDQHRPVSTAMMGLGDAMSLTPGLTPSAMTGAGGGNVVHLEFKTYNPVAEPQSRTTNKALDRVAAIGLVG